MAKKEVVSGVESFSVDLADNGFIVSYNGEDSEGDWASAKRIVGDMQELVRVITKINDEMT